MKKYLFFFLMLVLLVACKVKSSEEALAKEVIEVLEKAENKQKYQELTEHLDEDFLSAMGLSREDYAKNMENFMKKDLKKTNYTYVQAKLMEETEEKQVYLLTLQQSQGKEKSSGIPLNLVVTERGKDWTFIPMDMVKSYVLEWNQKKEYFHVNVPFVAEQSQGQTYVVDISNHSKNLNFYFTEKTTVEVETSVDSYKKSLKEIELKPGDSKRTNVYFPKAKGVPKRIIIWSMADESRYFDYSLNLEEKTK